MSIKILQERRVQYSKYDDPSPQVVNSERAVLKYYKFFNMSGLVGEIRSSTTSEQFDLGGYTEQRAADMIRGAFSTPLSAPTQMVRFTFVVGGGRLVRARYDEDMTRWLCGALREIGFVEDKSAAETFDSQGTYKQQHDTGQNLKYLIVYPRVECADRKVEGVTSSVEELDTSSNEYVIAASSLDIFKSLVTSKTQSWHQKKRILKVLQDSTDAFKAVEAKLIAGTPLTLREQAVYESDSGQDAEKLAWLQGEIKSMADGGMLTASERDELLETLRSSITALDEDIAAARSEGAVKKVEKLEERKAAVTARKMTIEKAPPVIHRLKRGEDIRKLRVRLLSLLSLEERGRSMSLTLADLKTLEQKGGECFFCTLCLLHLPLVHNCCV
jgi:hypothetical protein